VKQTNDATDNTTAATAVKTRRPRQSRIERLVGLQKDMQNECSTVLRNAQSDIVSMMSVNGIFSDNEMKLLTSARDFLTQILSARQ
jgi:hypothetical protein